MSHDDQITELLQKLREKDEQLLRKSLELQLSLSKNDMKQLNVSISADVIDKLKAEAVARGMPLQRLCRHIFAAHVAGTHIDPVDEPPKKKELTIQEIDYLNANLGDLLK